MGNRDERDMSEFGRILQRHMDAKGKRARELAAELDIKPVALSKYIGGILRPKPQILDGVEKALMLSPEEMAELRRAVDRARRGRALSPMDRRMAARHSAARLGERMIDTILRRIRRDCGFMVEEPPVDAPVRCDALISNPEWVDRQVGLIFLLQPQIDPGECVKVVKALKVFYEGLEGVLFYRPWLDHDDLAHERALREAGAEFVYDWSVIAAIPHWIQPTPQAQEWIVRTDETVRSILAEGF